ncbi:MAG: STAS domain-containing protein [Actinobacteria bacterium]|jgi:anti-sigma B factor antagonist|nr:STAS domain-containing protein [Actinomycetota bacterium]
MAQRTLEMQVRKPHEGSAIVDVKGDITGASEDILMDAYNQAEGARAIILNFEGLDYMNSGGIGLLVTLLVRAKRQHQKIFAFGLTEHYRQIFELTRLDDAIGIYATEADAVAAVNS